MLLALGYASLRLEGLRRESAGLEARKANLEKDILILQREAREAKAQAALAKEAIKGTNRIIEQTPQAADLLPRVYMLLGANTPTETGEQVANLLRAAGFIVPKITQVNRSLGETTVHFYREVDRDDANRAQEIIAKSGFRNVRVSLEKVPRDVKLRPRHFDLVLSSPEKREACEGSSRSPGLGESSRSGTGRSWLVWLGEPILRWVMAGDGTPAPV
jgi:hypothetical protein